MLVWYNKKGVLKEQLDSYGNIPRVGSQDFQIIAYFDGIDLNNISDARVRLQRPDLKGLKYPPMYMTRVNISYDESLADGPSQYFKEGGGPNSDGTYPCYLFDFSQFIDNGSTPLDYSDDRIVTLLDTPGLWKAVITLITRAGVSNVFATIKFNVEGDEGSEEALEVDVDAMFANLADAIARKLNIRNGIFVLANLDQNISGFQEGQIFLVESEGRFYRKENGVLVVDNEIMNPGHMYVTVEEPEYVIPPEDQ